MNAFEKVAELRRIGKFEEAISTLEDMAKEDEKNPDIHYQIGWTLDASGKSSQAIEHYEKSLELGLQDDRNGCYLALGSSLRAIGKYTESEKFLKSAILEFPSDKALKMFYAMTLYNVNRSKEAISILLQLLMDSTLDDELKVYKRAIDGYAEDLDRVY